MIIYDNEFNKTKENMKLYQARVKLNHNITYYLTSHNDKGKLKHTLGEMPFSAFSWFSRKISMQVLNVIKDALMLPKKSK